MEVYVILTDTGTLFTRMIKVFTKQPLNHASISFSRDLDITYSFGRKNMNNPFIGGFVKENLNSELFQRATCAIYSCSVSENRHRQMIKLIHEIELQQQNYKYNFIGLFGVLLNKKITRERAFFCSEFVATILNNGGISINHKPANLVKPSDLAESGQFRLLYKGDLCDYLSLHSNGKSMGGKHQNINRRNSRLFQLAMNRFKGVKSVS